MIYIVRGCLAVMACFSAVVLASCATVEVQSGAVAQADNGSSRGPLHGEEVHRIAALLQRQLYRCWKPPMVTNIIVTVRFALSRDGSLAGEPTLVNVTPGAQSQVVAESTLRAVRQCAPFKLPADRYEWWKEVEVNFDPSKMFTLRDMKP